MARTPRSLFAQLNALAEEISQNAEKVAAAKSASPVPADPGGYQGASSHPSAHVDNNVQKATTGSRASEYEADVKQQQGALAVDNTPELSQEGRQDDVQLNIGTNAAATGEDPAAEKDYKGTKDDPGTSHPAKANDGEKYSSVTFKQAHAKCSDLGNEILADLINFGTEAVGSKAAGMPDFIKDKINAKKDKSKDEDKDDGESKGKLKGDQHKIDVDGDGKIEGSDLAALRNGKKAAFSAGYELAAALGLDKEAAEANVRDVCANTLREADEMADLFVGFYTAKTAGADPTEEAAEGEDHSAEGDGQSGEAAPDMGGEMAGAPSVEDMMGGAGGGEMGAAPGGEPSEEEALQELAMALQELGISPEELMAGLAGGGGEMGGMPPEGMPPEAGAPKMAAAQELQMIGNAVANFKRAGGFQIKEARTKRSRQLRDIMKAHVRELTSR
jgi:hypothetical protein